MVQSETHATASRIGQFLTKTTNQVLDSRDFLMWWILFCCESSCYLLMSLKGLAEPKGQIMIYVEKLNLRGE